MKKFYFIFFVFSTLLFTTDIAAEEAPLAPMLMQEVPVNITFVVLVDGLDIAPDGMQLAGSFSDWEDISMMDNGDGTWSTTVELESGTTAEYNFKNGLDSWELGDGGDCFDQFDSRILEVPEMDTTLPVVYYGSCDENPPVAAEGVDIIFTVNTSAIEVSEEGMNFARAFTNWTPVPMTDNGDGTWSITVSLPAGSVVEYNFINGFDAYEDGSNPACFDESGIRVLEVPAESTVLPTVYFSSCDNNPPPVLASVPVTFTVNASEVTVGGLGVIVVGSFTNYIEVPMTDNGDGTWTTTVEITENSFHYYTFGLGNFDNEIIFGAGDCSDYTSSRTLEVGSEPMNLSPVYYNSCTNSPPPVYEMVDITFTVDMSDVELDEVATFVGNFNGLRNVVMDDNGDGTWSITLSLPVGVTVYYNFTNGFLEFEAIEGDCFNEDGVRSYVVPATAESVAVVPFSDCAEGATTNTIDLVTNNSLEVAPNPFQSETLVTWENPNNGSYNIQLFDISGQLIRQYLQVTGNSLGLQGANLNTGMYFLKFRNDKGATATLKLIVE